VRRVDLDGLEPGMKLALPVRCRYSYQVLLNAGVVINEQHIKKIRRLKPSCVYIFSPDFANHPGQHLYHEAVSTMDNVFQNVFAGEKIDIPEVKQVVGGIMGQLEEKNQILIQLARLNDADSYSVSHCVNVCIYSLFIGKLLNLSREDLGTLGLGAILHDIGKLHVPEALLRKPAKLSDNEFSIIKDHPLTGYKSLDDQDAGDEVRKIVRDHHEKCDGSGYPNGLHGDEISFLTKIVTVADIYDAVTSDRSYRTKMLPHEGMEILIANCSAGKIEKKIVDVFTREVIIYPKGCLVRLNTGELAEVTDGSTVTWRPKVQIKEGRKTRVVNLALEPTVFISEILRYNYENNTC